MRDWMGAVWRANYGLGAEHAQYPNLSAGTHLMSSTSTSSGQVRPITGVNTGIGLVTGRELARRGAYVSSPCRSQEKGAQPSTGIQSHHQRRAG